MTWRLDDLAERLQQLGILCAVVPVLEERMSNFGKELHEVRDEVKGMKRALWGLVFSILGGCLLFLLSVASGWIGG